MKKTVFATTALLIALSLVAYTFVAPPFEGIGKALGLVSAIDAQGWFKSCGYTQLQS